MMLHLVRQDDIYRRVSQVAIFCSHLFSAHMHCSTRMIKTLLHGKERGLVLIGLKGRTCTAIEALRMSLVYSCRSFCFRCFLARNLQHHETIHLQLYCHASVSSSIFQLYWQG